VHRTNLAVESTALRQAQAASRKKDIEFAILEQQLRGEISALRSQLAVEEKGANVAAHHAIMLERQLDEARRTTSVDAVAARVVARDRELAEAEHLRITSETAERDELAALAVQQSLAKVEADFAQERAVHQARGRSQKTRLNELEDLFGGCTRHPVTDGACTNSNNESSGKSLRCVPSSSPFALNRLASNSALMDPFSDATPAQGSRQNIYDHKSPYLSRVDPIVQPKSEINAASRSCGCGQKAFDHSSSHLGLVTPLSESTIELNTGTPPLQTRPCLTDFAVTSSTNPFGIPAIGYDSSPTGQNFSLVAPAVHTPSAETLELLAPTSVAVGSLATLPSLPVECAGAKRRMPSNDQRAVLASHKNGHMLTVSPIAMQLALPMSLRRKSLPKLRQTRRRW